MTFCWQSICNLLEAISGVSTVTRKKPGATEKGQTRSSVFENLLEPISPGNLPVLLIDKDFKPITDIEIKVTLASGQKLTKKTDSDGTTKIARQQGEMELSVA